MVSISFSLFVWFLQRGSRRTACRWHLQFSALPQLRQLLPSPALCRTPPAFGHLLFSLFFSFPSFAFLQAPGPTQSDRRPVAARRRCDSPASERDSRGRDQPTQRPARPARPSVENASRTGVHNAPVRRLSLLGTNREISTSRAAGSTYPRWRTRLRGHYCSHAPLSRQALRTRCPRPQGCARGAESVRGARRATFGWL